MIILTSPQVLKIQLSGSVSAELPVMVSYVDLSTTTYTPASVVTTTSGTTLVTIVTTPAAAVRREVKLLSVHNPNVATATVKLFLDTTKILQVDLALNSTLYFTDADGFKVMLTSGSNGAQGPPGTNGTNGTNGSNGSNGTNGTSATGDNDQMVLGYQVFS